MRDNTILLKEKALFLYNSNKLKDLKLMLSAINEVDLAELFYEFDSKTKSVIFRLLPKELAADVFVELDEDVQAELITGFSDSEISNIINMMYVDDAVDVVEEMPANVVRRVLARVEPDMRKMINEILRYPEDSAGSIMNTEYIYLKPTMTAKQALLHIRDTGIDKETVNTLYIINKHRKLMGEISIRDLIFLQPEQTIDIALSNSDIIYATTTDDKEYVAQIFNKYSLTELPVVDNEKRLVGIITVDDAIDVITEEATEDIEVMAAITPSDKPYLKQSVFAIFKSRIPWLLLLMLSATFTGIIISNFEGALAVIPILSAFIPMLMGTGGNAGAQSSATVNRGLALKEITLKDALKVILKELGTSALCGACLFAAMFIKMLTVDKFLIGSEITISVALVVSLTLFLTVMLAKITGGLLPLLAKRLGFDPAVMASPFITTITDTVTLAIYFVIAINVLNI